MCERADWMRPEDDHVFALLRTERKDTLATVVEQLPLPRDRAADRCRTLAERGLVEDLGSEIYTISPRGKRDLDGDLDAADLEETDP